MDFYDTRIIKSVSTSIVLDNGEIREISNNFSSGGAVRVLNGGSWGFVSLDGVCGNLDAVISSAGRLAESARNRSPRPPIDLAPITGPGLKDLPEIKEKPQDIPIEDKVKLLLEIEKSAKKTGIQSTNAVYSEALINVKYSSSEGLDCEYTLTRIGFAISSIAQSEGVYQIGRESRFGVMGFEIFKKHDAFALAEKAANTAIELLSAKTPKAGTYPVILDQELAGVFIHEAVGHAVEADHVLEGNSILSGKIGEQIASPLITVYDDPSLHEYGYYPFDDEGAESKRTTLIQNGVLKSFIHSRETAGKLGGESRNSRAQGYSRPVIRMSNTFIAPDGMKFDEMLAELKDGIYLKGSRGGQVNPGEGVFQFNAESGFIVKKRGADNITQGCFPVREYS